MLGFCLARVWASVVRMPFLGLRAWLDVIVLIR